MFHIWCLLPETVPLYEPLLSAPAIQHVSFYKLASECCQSLNIRNTGLLKKLPQNIEH